MSFSYSKALLLTVALGAFSTARADVLLDIPSFTFDGTQPLQTARLFRDAVPSTWATSKLFPGTSGSGNRAYTTFNLGVISLMDPVYIQISIDDPSTSFFAAAYSQAYTPNPSPNASGYLGDAGSSGNNFGNPRFFQVILPANQALIVPVMELNNGGGNRQTFGLLVEGFRDSNFTPLAPAVPEPGTFLISASGLGVLLAGSRILRRQKQSDPQKEAK